jgi:hypothetical protein
MLLKNVAACIVPNPYKPHSRFLLCDLRAFISFETKVELLLEFSFILVITLFKEHIETLSFRFSWISFSERDVEI